MKHVPHLMFVEVANPIITIMILTALVRLVVLEHTLRAVKQLRAVLAVSVQISSLSF